MKTAFVKKLFLSLSMLLFACSPLASFDNDLNNLKKDSIEEIYDLPDLDNTDCQDENNSPINIALKKLVKAKEILLDNIIINLYKTSEKPLTITLKDVDISLQDINRSEFNLSCKVIISYQGINEELDIFLQSLDYIFITHRNNAFKFSCPHTLKDLFGLLKALNINFQLSKSEGDFSLFEIVKIFKDTIFSLLDSSFDNSSSYLLKVADITRDDLTVSNLALELKTDSSCSLESFKTEDEIIISSKSSDIHLSLSGKIKEIKSVSSFDKKEEGFIDVSQTNHALIKTITDLFSTTSDGSTNAKIKIDISADFIKKNSENSFSSSYINGDISADLTNVFQDENQGEYYLHLSHQANETPGSEIYNDLGLYFNNENLYLTLGSILKNKISKTALKDVFSKIASLTEKVAFKEIDKDLNLIFSVVDKKAINRLLDGQLDAFYSIFKSYSYSDNGFILHLDPKGLSLDGDDLVITIKTCEEQIEKITISELVLGSISLKNITFSLSEFTGIDKPVAEEYSSLDSCVSLFDTISCLVDKKKFNADYTLTFLDSNNTLFDAMGNISADLSSSLITSNDDEKIIPLNTGNYYLSFLLPKDESHNQNNTALGQGIEMYYDGSLKNLYFGYQYYPNSQFDLLNDGHYVFRNSLSDSDIKDMYRLLDSKVENETDSSSSLISMGSLISAITDSEKFIKLKEDLTNHLSTSALSGVIFLDINDDGEIEITLDPSSFLKGTDYEANTTSIQIKLSHTLELISLNARGKINGNTIAFSLDINDDVKTYDYFNTDDYPLISHGASLLDSFVSLPTDLENFDVELTGTIKKDDEAIPLLTIEKGTGASVDTTTEFDKASGVLYLKHKDINDKTKLISYREDDPTTLDKQKVEFLYTQEEGQTRTHNNRLVDNGNFILEYNDHMHVKMENKDIFSILTTLQGVKDESNLLFRYLKFLNSAVESSGSPLLDIINKKAISTSKIFDYPYFKNLTFIDNKIILDIDPKLIKSEVESGSTCLITISYDELSHHINKADINASLLQKEDEKMSSLTIQASISLLCSKNQYERNKTEDVNKVTQDKNVLSYSSSTKTNFVDINGFSLLIKVLVNTTERNFFHISGHFSAKISAHIITDINLTSITVYCDCKIYVADETAYAHLRFTKDNKNKKDENYKAREIFIKEKEVWCNKIEVVKEKNGGSFFRPNYRYKLTSKVYKTTQENFVDNLAYYLLDYIMQVQDLTGGKLINANIFKAINESDNDKGMINNDFSQVLISTSHQTNADSSGSFNINVNLNNLLKIDMLSFSNNPNIQINFNSDEIFSSISTDINLKAASIIDIKGSLNFSLSTANIQYSDAKNNASYLKRFFNFTNNFASDNRTKNLPTYIISSIDASSTSYSLNDNSSQACYTFTLYSSTARSPSNDINYDSYWYCP